MRQHRGNEVSIENKLIGTITFFINNNLVASYLINSNNQCITVESYDSKRFALELSTARQALYITLIIHSFAT